MTELRKTAGRWNSDDRQQYFLAGSAAWVDVASSIHKYLLIAMNELGTDNSLNLLNNWLNENKSVIIDSGVYAFANQHAKANNMSMDAALSLTPEKVDGWDILQERYIRVCKQYGEKSWGYFELDQGGKDNKTRLRTMLEDEGLRPVPIYHPINDGWDYFDFLAERYDRICMGNVVQASRPDRKRLVAIVWERKRKYPNLWIHLLGLTPNEWANSYIIDSADSSSWMSTIRWAGLKPKADGKPFSELSKNYKYLLASDSLGQGGSQKAVFMAAYGATMHQRNWKHHISDWNSLGLNLEPSLE